MQIGAVEKSYRAVPNVSREVPPFVCSKQESKPGFDRSETPVFEKLNSNKYGLK